MAVRLYGISIKQIEEAVAGRPERVVDRDDEIEPDAHLPRSLALNLHQRERVRQEVEA